MSLEVKLAKAYLLGVYLGDGHAQWSQYENGAVYQFVVPSLDQDLLEKTSQCLVRIYPELKDRIRIITEPRTGKTKGVLYRLICHSKELCRFLIRKTKKKNKLPKFKNPTLFKEFVSGLMDTDGWITEWWSKKDDSFKYQMGFATTLPWLKKLKKRFQKAGIVIGKIQKQCKYNDNWNDCYRMYLNISSFVDAGFYFSIKRKQQRLLNWIERIGGASSTTLCRAPEKDEDKV